MAKIESYINLLVEHWYSHQTLNLLQKNNKNRTDGPLCRVFSPIRERADNLSLMKKNIVSSQFL